MGKTNANQSSEFFRVGFFVLWFFALANMHTSTLSFLMIAAPCFYWWLNGRKGVAPRVRIAPPMITWIIGLIAFAIFARGLEMRDQIGRSQWGSEYSVETAFHSEGPHKYASHTPDTGSTGGNVLLGIYGIAIQLATVGFVIWTYRIEQSWQGRLGALGVQDGAGE
jgi:hypothetical protein